MKHNKPQIYTITMAKLLMDWRTSQGISRYEIAKRTGININTVKRLEEGAGGISFEDGLRYLTYTESHKSKPNLIKRFHQAMAVYLSVEDMANVIMAQRKQREAEASRKASERHQIEQSTRQAVQMEMSNQLTSLTAQYNAKTDRLKAELRSTKEQMISLQKGQQITAERHKKELEEAKRLGAEEAQQAFKNKTLFERIKG